MMRYRRPLLTEYRSYLASQITAGNVGRVYSVKWLARANLHPTPATRLKGWSRDVRGQLT